MKKRKWRGLLLLLLLLFLCEACGRTGNAAEKNAQTAEQKEEPDSAEIKEEAEESAEEQTDTEEQKIELTIYYGNETADGLEAEQHNVTEVTPEAIIGYLAEHGIVTPDTKVKAFSVETDGERKVLCLDLSKDFGEYINTKGTSGEAVIMTALANTFLEAYEAEAICLTVEGAVLETGHAVYDGELTYMELTPEGWN